MVKSTERLCYYETLGLAPNCSMDDVRHAYHELSKIYHPDKYKPSCGMPKDEASIKFLKIKDAYDILKEPHERALYDSYRQTYAVPEAFDPDLEAAFDNISFNGYSDSCRGFYNVYSDVFERIFANERAFQERNGLPWGSVHNPPSMGNIDSPYPEVVQFYHYWLNFKSIRDFRWEEPHDEYDLSQVSRRTVKRRWSRLNMKARKKAKKAYNKKVRSLAQNAKRLDKRIMLMTAKRDEERKREIEEERERMKQLKKEKLEKAAREYEEPEWTKVVERRRKYGYPKEEEMVKEIEEWECVVCRKGFKSEMQCRNHEQSKKHLRMVAELIELQSNHHDIVVQSMEDEKDPSQELDFSAKAKGDEVNGNSDEFSDRVGDSKWENFSQAVESDEAEQEEMDEMDVLLAMVARRKTMEKQVGQKVLEPMVEYMETSSREEKDADEVAIKHDQLKHMNNTGEESMRKSKRRRRVKGTRTNHHDSSNTKEWKLDSSEGDDDETQQMMKRNSRGEKERTSNKSKKSRSRGDKEETKRNRGATKRG